MNAAFFTLIEKRVRETGSPLCVGLDPRSPMEGILEENKRLIEATAPYAACYKPNIAFYEAHGPAGLEILKKTLELIPEGIPVIMDAKRADIGSTAEAYAKAIYGWLGAEAVTLSPYMGKDSVDPFLKDPSKGVFLLCRTSNPGAPLMQDLDVEGEPLYVAMARKMTAWDPRVGLVVAGNDTEALAAVRAACPDAWFLAPGIGAQGGTMAEAFAAGARKDGMGLLLNVSRQLADAADPAAEAKKLVEQARAAAAGVAGKTGMTAADPLRKKVLGGLIKTECFKTGQFILKSGKTSPFYIDLRKIQSDPALLKAVAKAYASLAVKVKCDRIAGIPVAALPLATAVSLETGIPLIYPRMTMKEHGTGNRIEGTWNKGERILLLDDLITTGKSKIEAVEILRGEGLIVEDLVVLIERGREGRRDMNAAGINLHAYAQIGELLDACLEKGLITKESHSDMIRYAQEG
jgi:uridine monophosphate synthetase